MINSKVKMFRQRVFECSMGYHFFNHLYLEVILLVKKLFLLNLQ